MNGQDDPQAPKAQVSMSTDVFRDLFGIAGAGLAGYGAWLHYPPAGYVLGGLMMVTMAVVGTMYGRR